MAGWISGTGLLEIPLILHYVDVGAANNTREEGWKKHNQNVRYTLFEPDPIAAERLRGALHEEDICVIENALGSFSGKTFLNVCKKRELSSILEPNTALLKRFPDVSRWSVVEQLEVNLKTLDSMVSTIGPVDFLKLDTQGSELDVLHGAVVALKEVVAIQVEVEFIPLYLRQPLFGDITNFLLQEGFEFWDFTTIYRYGREVLNRTGQAAFADSLFFKPPENILGSNNKQNSILKLQKLALISEVFGMTDIKKICEQYL